MSAGSLKGKVAVITGGAAGIGRAAALALAADGADIGVMDINLEGAQETVSLVEQAGCKATAAAVDVSDGDSVREGLKAISSALGTPLVLFSNAGIGNTPIKFENENFEEWKRQFAVHVDGAFHTVHQMLPGMVSAEWGRVVLTSSIAATMGIKGAVSYSAAKGALLGMTHSLALEYASKGITVNAVAPGFIDTAMFHEVGGKVVAMVEGTIPMKHLGEPEDIAQAVAYLCSEQGRYMTGQVISPNGGIWFP
jgi:NAD(P)-dependent dehydrogenase (short-subunit alcohol dehydrogenase family)